MQQDLLVTIVTPAYNQAGYLAATIESVLAQDYPHIEYIVIDDGSSDDSLDVALRYVDRGVTVLTQSNSGQAATLNRGWAAAKGQVLAYLSSDDCLCPNAVSSMVAALQARPDASVAYCDFWLIDAAGRRLREVRAEEFSAQRLCVDLVCQPGPGAFFRRAVFDHTGGWNPALRQVPDFDFWLRAVRLGDFLRVPQSLAEYRIHEGSASFRVMPAARAEEILRVVEAYWSDGHDGQRALSALARAGALAAKNHAQSGRPLRALQCFAKAVSLRPSMALESGVWRQVVVGMLRRAYYKLKLRSA